jgi:hypothetical protein
MKLYSTIILVFLIAYINSDCDDVTPSGKKDCKDKLSDADKNKGYSYCCYLESEKGEKGCWKLTKDDYNDIEGFKTKEEKDAAGQLKIKTLYCNSLFIKLGFMNILFFLL